jgi:hypothetical protein
MHKGDADQGACRWFDHAAEQLAPDGRKWLGRGWRSGGHVDETVEQLVSDPEVEAIYLASPVGKPYRRGLPRDDMAR